MYGLFGVYGGMVSIIPYGMLLYGMVWYGMVWYVSKPKHKETLGTCGSVLERLEACRKRLNAFRTFWERMGAFSRLGMLGSIIPYGMVCM